MVVLASPAIPTRQEHEHKRMNKDLWNGMKTITIGVFVMLRIQSFYVRLQKGTFSKLIRRLADN